MVQMHYAKKYENVFGKSLDNMNMWTKFLNHGEGFKLEC
jgi:hypothetical protein